MYVCSSFKRKENIIGRHRRFGKLHAKWMQELLTEGPMLHGLLLMTEFQTAEDKTSHRAKCLSKQLSLPN